MPSVVQPWVSQISFMQQSVLLSAIRGADGADKYASYKKLQRWLRRCILISAFDGIVLTNPFDPRGGKFTGPVVDSVSVKLASESEWELGMESYINGFFASCDSLPHHFILHFTHAAEIIGYMHPDERIAKWWEMLYNRIVASFHMKPETKEEMLHRLGDNETNWLELSEPGTLR